ncbi:MAG: hypothetical protein Fur0010_23710 [Bdellovibrio sp.]
MNKENNPSDIYKLYDEYCHGQMERRDFLKRAAGMTLIGGLSGLSLAKSLLPNYAKAQTIC